MDLIAERENAMNLKQRIDEAKSTAFEYGQKFGIQRACDFIAIILNSPEIMGKSVMSGERISTIIEAALKLSDDYITAYRPKDPEADYYQEKLDERQKKIFKDKFVPFDKRYWYLKKVRY